MARVNMISLNLMGPMYETEKPKLSTKSKKKDNQNFFLVNLPQINVRSYHQNTFQLPQLSIEPIEKGGKPKSRMAVNRNASSNKAVNKQVGSLFKKVGEVISNSNHQDFNRALNKVATGKGSNIK